jgi:predicted N-acetyltransferase YhbS
MRTNPEVRILTPEERPQILELKQLAFGMPASRFMDIDFESSENYGIYDNGTLAGMVSMTPKELLIGDSKIIVGGIGAVSTHPEARGKGTMRKLLNYSIDRMRELNIPLSILWGDTQRYRHFGWETCGKKIHFAINARSMIPCSIKDDFTIEPYNIRKHLPSIIALHDKKQYRVKRQRADFERFFGKPSVMVWFAQQSGDEAYVVQEGEYIIEYAGNFDVVCQCLHYLLENHGHSTLTVQQSPFESIEKNDFYKISSWWTIEPLGMLKILNLEYTIKALIPQTQNRGAAPERISLKMLDSGQAVTINAGKDVYIEQGCKTKSEIELSDIDMTRLVFYGNISTGQPESDRLISAMFPLKLYWPRLDAV